MTPQELLCKVEGYLQANLDRGLTPAQIQELLKLIKENQLFEPMTPYPVLPQPWIPSPTIPDTPWPWDPIVTCKDATDSTLPSDYS